MSTENKILIVDDDPGLRKTLSDILKAKGYIPIDVAKGKSALGKVDDESPAVALIDIKLEEMDGLEVLKEVKERSPETECIVLTGFASQDSAIEAVNLGAYSYIQKPYNVEQLLLTIQRAIEKRSASEALRESEEKFRNLAEQSPNMIFINKKGRIVYANKRCEEIMGYMREEFYSPEFDYLTLIAPEYIELIKSKFTQHMRGEDVPPYEYAIIAKDGKRIEAVITPKVIQYEGERAILGTVTDITEQKQAEEALKESEERYRLLFTTASEGIVTLDIKGSIENVNPTFLRMTGFERDEIVGKNVTHLARFFKINPKQVLTKFRDFISGKTVETDWIISTKEGAKIDIRVFPSLIKKDGKIIGISTIITDVTDRKRAEEALKESEERYRTLIETSPTAIVMGDTQGKILFVNEYLAKMHGYNDSKELLSEVKNIRELVTPESQEVLKREFENMLQNGYSKMNEYVLHRKDGSKFTASVTASQISDSKDMPIGFMAVAIDITERKQAEEALQESEEKYRNLIDQSHDAIYLLHNGKFEIVNKRFEELFGYTQKETNTPDFDFMNLIASKSRAMVEERVKKIEGGEIVPPQYEFIAITRDGREIEVETSVSYVQYKGSIATQGILRDITERKQLQEQLLQSEKMSALGQLISGVAHELNNPMTGVLGFSQLLLLSENIPNKEKQTLEKINQEAERVRRIIQNLLTFARQRKPEKRLIQINEVVNRSLDLRAYEMNVSNIEVISNLEPDLPAALADDHQLQQIFMNLIINAEQAMLAAHGKGCLEVTTRCDTKRDVVQISFRDDGPGISEEYLPRVFDPFFTTKPVGKGTGLGLSIAYGIIEGHGGRIIAVNNADCGTTFTVELPRGEVPYIEEESLSQKADVVTGVGKKNILVVDDETSVVDLVRAALEREGHAVETAHDGNAALEKIEKRKYDAIVSDLKMPGKHGTEIYLYCKENIPDLAKRFIFLTGDIVDPDSLRFMEEQKVSFISKPFDLNGLLSSLNQLF